MANIKYKKTDTMIFDILRIFMNHPAKSMTYEAIGDFLQLENYSCDRSVRKAILTRIETLIGCGFNISIINKNKKGCKFYYTPSLQNDKLNKKIRFLLLSHLKSEELEKYLFSNKNGDQFNLSEYKNNVIISDLYNNCVTDRDVEKFETINKAIIENQLLSITFHNLKSKEPIIIKPYGLIYEDDNYILGYLRIKEEYKGSQYCLDFTSIKDFETIELSSDDYFPKVKLIKRIEKYFPNKDIEPNLFTGESLEPLLSMYKYNLETIIKIPLKHNSNAIALEIEKKFAGNNVIHYDLPYGNGTQSYFVTDIYCEKKDEEQVYKYVYNKLIEKKNIKNSINTTEGHYIEQLNEIEKKLDKISNSVKYSKNQEETEEKQKFDELRKQRDDIKLKIKEEKEKIPSYFISFYNYNHKEKFDKYIEDNKLEEIKEEYWL